jgi:hypothetical protein
VEPCVWVSVGMRGCALLVLRLCVVHFLGMGGYGYACVCEFARARRAQKDTESGRAAKRSVSAVCFAPTLVCTCHICLRICFIFMRPACPVHRSFKGFRMPQAFKMRTSSRSNTFRLKAFPTIIPSCLSDIPTLRCKTGSGVPCNLSRSAKVMRRPRAGKYYPAAERVRVRQGDTPRIH